MPKIVNITNTTYGLHVISPTPYQICHGPAQVQIHTPTRVLSDGHEVSILTDLYTPGVCISLVGGADIHPVKVRTASPNVFAGGISIVRDRDPMTCIDLPGFLSSISNVNVN